MSLNIKVAPCEEIFGFSPLTNSIDKGPSCSLYAYDTSKGPRAATDRQSGCAFDGYFFTLQPRINWYSHEEFRVYLDLQGNPIVAGSNTMETDGNVFNYENGADALTFQASLQSANEGNGDTRFITAMCAGSMGGAYATWVETPYSATTVDSVPALRVLPVILGGDVYKALDVTKGYNLTLDGAPVTSSGQAAVQDLCCTVVGTVAVYFVKFWDVETVYTTVFNGSSLTPLQALDMSGIIDVQEIWSFDALTVNFQVDRTQDSNVFSTEQIALTLSLTDTSGASKIPTIAIASDPASQGAPLNSQNCCLLSVVDNEDPLPLPVSSGKKELKYSEEAVISSIRSVWGVTPLVSCQNSIILMLDYYKTIFYGATDEAGESIPSVKRRRPVDSEAKERLGYASSYGDYYTVVDLEANFPVQVGDWQWVGISPLNYQPGTGFRAEIIQKGSYMAGFNSTAGLAGFFLRANSVTDNDGFYINSNLMTVQFPSFRFASTLDTIKDEVYLDNWLVDQFTAALPCWSLLGVIAGLPPVPDLSKVTSSLEIKYIEESSNSVTSETSSSVGASAEAKVGSIGASGGFSQINKFTKSEGTTNKLTLDYPWVNAPSDSSGGDPMPEGKSEVPPSQGILMFVRPTYARDTYRIYSWDSSDTKLKIDVLYVDSGKLVNYPFNLKDPSIPVDYPGTPENLMKALAQYQTNYVKWADTDDLDGWKQITQNTDIIDSLVASDDDKSGLQGQIVNSFTTPNIITAFTDADTFSLTSENKLSTGATLGISVFKFGGNYTYTNSTKITYTEKNTFSLGYSFTVTGNDEGTQESLSDTFESYSVRPLFCKADSDTLPWIPSYAARQRPWLLTWLIT